MRTRAQLFLVAAAATILVLPGPVAAKEFEGLAVVGSRGDSIQLRGLTNLVFSSPRPARPRGGYVRLYPLGEEGFVGVPGRFYPATAAVCLDWEQARPPRDCKRAAPRLARALRGLPLAQFLGSPTTVRRLRSAGLTRVQLRQLEPVFELAFDRSQLARRARRPAPCRRFRATWLGPAARERPPAFCLSARGAYARERLYPLGRAPWQLVVGWAPRFPSWGT